MRAQDAVLREKIVERTPEPASGRQAMSGNLQVVLDRDADEQARFSVFGDGEIARIAAGDPDLAAQLESARRAGDSGEEARLWAELERRFRERHAPVALSGTVPCNVDAGYGAIRPGDLLTTSPTAGHAMRADDPRPGTIVGKALEPLGTGTGVIRVLVMLR